MLHDIGRGLVVVLVLLASVLLASSSVDAVVLRHDRDLAKTLELGSRYPFVCAAGAGTGTLIEPRWVLTAAHVVENFGPFDFEVRCGDQRVQVERTCIHAGKEEMPWDRRSDDIALLRLERHPEGIPSAVIYRGGDELTRVGVIVGVGTFGSAGSPPTRKDGRRRAVTNKILDLDPHWLKVVFSRPPGGTDLEGVGAEGDSGGPLMIEVEGKPYVAGVGSYAEFIDAEGDEGSYGILDFYTRVSAYADWIDRVLAGGRAGNQTDCQGPQPPEKIVSAAGGLPSNPAGQRATDYFRAFNSGSAEDYRAFLVEDRADVEESSPSLNDRVEAYRSRWKRWGPLRPARYVEGEGELYVLVRSRLGEMTFHFTVDPDPPHKLTSLVVSAF